MAHRNVIKVFGQLWGFRYLILKPHIELCSTLMQFLLHTSFFCLAMSMVSTVKWNTNPRLHVNTQFCKSHGTFIAYLTTHADMDMYESEAKHDMRFYPTKSTLSSSPFLLLPGMKFNISHNRGSSLETKHLPLLHMYMHIVCVCKCKNARVDHNYYNSHKYNISLMIFKLLDSWKEDIRLLNSAPSFF